jgi:hypothetical protein
MSFFKWHGFILAESGLIANPPSSFQPYISHYICGIYALIPIDKRNGFMRESLYKPKGANHMETPTQVTVELTGMDLLRIELAVRQALRQETTDSQILKGEAQATAIVRRNGYAAILDKLINLDIRDSASLTGTQLPFFTI